MGRKKVSSHKRDGGETVMLILQPAGAGTTLALQVDADGDIRYDAIAQHGRAAGSRVQSSFKGELVIPRQASKADCVRSGPACEQIRRNGRR